MSSGRNSKWLASCFLVLVALTSVAEAQKQPEAVPNESGGPLLYEQAAFDVTHYDLTLRINPDEQSIKGAVIVEASIVHPTRWFVLDLDTALAIDAVTMAATADQWLPLPYERRSGKIWIAFPLTRQPGDSVKVRVAYGGKPRIAPRPPWDDGFVWKKTPGGAHWVGVTCFEKGADLWWPCKDHPSDEADSVSLHITVPEPLVCASNGRLQSVTKNDDGTRTFNWFVSTPINNYDVTINLAPYRTLEAEYKSVTGESVPAVFYVLPENYEKAKPLFAQFLKMVRFYEENLGPYPFRADKLGIANTPYQGMEHQTIVSYGDPFKDNAFGFDWLLLHEFGHEWWGNLVTAADFRDLWIHEGFEEYMECLYAEHLGGIEAYHNYFNKGRRRMTNVQAVAPRESLTAHQIYGDDVYFKGRAILHTLRYLIGDQAMFTALRRMAYPDPQMEKIKDGKQCRFVTTDDFLRIAEEASGLKLDWFFEVYLRQPKLPRLLIERKDDALLLRWDTPNNLPFTLPVEVQIGDHKQRYEMRDGQVTIPIKPGEQPVIDPKNWILKAE